MATGRKSILNYLKIPNFKSPEEHFTVQVQSNKNGGICDVTLGTLKKTEREIEVKSMFDKKIRRKKVVDYKFTPKKRMSDILSTFQGRQFKSQWVQEDLSDILTAVLN